MTKEALQQNIKQFYWYQAFHRLGFMLPIVVLFWQENGLSMAEIMILQSIFAIGIVALEVPTGYLADVWGRKKTLILGGLFLALAYVLFSISSTFWMFVITELAFSISIALVSGSDAALLYDTLKELGREKEYQKIWGKAAFITFITISLTNIIGGYIGAFSFRLTMVISIPFALLLAIIALRFTEPKRHKLIIKKGYGKELLRIVKYALHENKKLKWLIIYAGVIYAFYQSALWFYQPYFTLTGLDIVHFGFVFASFQIVAAISSKYAHRIESWLGQKSSLILLFVLVFTSYFLMGNFVYWFSFSFGFMHQFIRGFFKVVISDYVNKLTDSAKRATVLSIQNMFSSLMYALIIPIFGRVADILTLTQTFLLMGTTTFVFAGTILLILHAKKIV